MSTTVTCENCGDRVRIPPDFSKRKIRCPLCGVLCAVPSSHVPAEEPPPPKETKPKRRPKQAKHEEESPSPAPTLELEEPEERVPAHQQARSGEEDDDNSDPYSVEAAPTKRCSECHGEIPSEAKICPRCGYDHQTKKRIKRSYQPVQRSWQSGWPRARRLIAFGSLAGLMTFSSIVLGVTTGEWAVTIGSLLFFSAMMAFLLGTYNRVDVTRNKKGRVRISVTWYVCFFKGPENKHSLADYNGIQTSVAHDTGCLEWYILIMFLPTVVGAILWWWYVIRSDTYQVALTRDHGYSAGILYRGLDENLMDEIAESIRGLTGLPRETE